MQSARVEAHADTMARQRHHAIDEVDVLGVYGPGQDGDAHGCSDGPKEDGREGLSWPDVGEEHGHVNPGWMVVSIRYLSQCPEEEIQQKGKETHPLAQAGKTTTSPQPSQDHAPTPRQNKYP